MNYLAYFKDNEKAGPYLTYIYRYVGIFIAYHLRNSRITPNHVSILNVFVRIISVYFMLLGGYTNLVFGIVILQISMFLDYTDGSLARIKHMSSKFGAWIDYMPDNIFGPAVIFSLAWVHYVATGFTFVWVLAFIASSVMFLVRQAYEYVERQGLNLNSMEDVKGRISNLYYTQANIFLLATILGLLNMLGMFFWISAVYGILFLTAILVFFSHKMRSI